MKQTRTLADIRPNATIRCMYCNQDQPQAGAVKFRAHHVCGSCASKLQAIPNNQPRKTKP